MKTTVLALLTAALLAPVAKADKFWLVHPDEAKSMAAGSPAFLHGVLLAEDANTYTLRVVGGELVIAKKSVVKVEKDDLTVEKIQQTEKADVERLAQDDQQRRQAQAAEASARRAQVQAVEASLRREPAPVASDAPTYDPVLHVVAGPDGVRSLGEERRAARRAYDLTGDSRYLVLLRQLRRMR